MIFAALSEAADRGELLLVPDGLCRFRLRRDGVVVIREIIVLPFRRREGIGRSMITEIRDRHPQATVMARCPACYHVANAFWAKLGFQRQDTAEEINLWQRQS